MIIITTTGTIKTILIMMMMKMMMMMILTDFVNLTQYLFLSKNYKIITNHGSK